MTLEKKLMVTESDGKRCSERPATRTGSAGCRLAARSLLALLAMSLLLATTMLMTPAASSAQVSIGVGVSVGFAPPPLPMYEQPICAGPGYIWTPGYWAYDPVDGYYWVPGTWVMAPFEGALWTPGYWGWSGDAFVWHVGYWGPVVGFYGGINYGFGYTGMGYAGGYWNGGRFFYNRTVNNINTTNITNVYNKTVVNNVTVNHVSYNGGNGGVMARPTQAELAATANARHVAPTAVQVRQDQAARANRAQWASVNHGAPAVAATAKPGVFSGRGVVRASRAGGVYVPPAAARAVAGSRTAANTGRPAAQTPNPRGGGTRPLITAHPNTTRPTTHANVRPATPNPTVSRPTTTSRVPARSPAGSTANRTESRHTTASRAPARTPAQSRPHPTAPARYSPPRQMTPHAATRTPSVPQQRSASRPHVATPQAAPQRQTPARPAPNDRKPPQ
jgi:hypothetical protein